MSIDWIALVNVSLDFFAALDFGNPIVFYGTMPLWAFPITLILYIAVLAIKWERETNPDLHWTIKHGLYYVAGSIGIVLDFYLNIITMTLVCFDAPREWVVTERLRRYHKLQPKNWRQQWRYSLSRFVCNKWLNPFDRTGTHC